MSAPTVSGSAYPPAVEALVPRAIELADSLGETPSIRRLISELRIGAPKARLLANLVATERGTPLSPDTDTDTDTAGTEPVAAPVPGVVDTGAPDASVDAVSEPEPVTDPEPNSAETTVAKVESAQRAVSADTPARPDRAPRSWPVLLLALPAFVAIWSGWVGLGGLTGFGMVHPLPGVADNFAINTAITLPIGVETYAAYAIRAWLSPGVPPRARAFARWSAIGSLALGAAGQVAYHLMIARGVTHAPWPITTAVACLPVAVLGMGAALAHLLRAH